MRILIATACIVGAQCFGALAPFHQSVVELEQVVSNKEVARQLPEPIESIAANSSSVTITTNSCQLRIGLETVPKPKFFAGPREFKVVVGKASCTKPESTPRAYADSAKKVSALLKSSTEISEEVGVGEIRTLTLLGKGIVLTTDDCTVAAEETGPETYKILKAVCLPGERLN